MLRFIGDTIKFFFGLIFIAIPLSLLVIWLLVKFMTLCVWLAGIAGMFLGFMLLIAMLFASMVHL